jgi:hypothetical protein
MLPTKYEEIASVRKRNREAKGFIKVQNLLCECPFKDEMP